MRVTVSIMQSYVLILAGGFLAMFAHIYWLSGYGDWFNPQRLSDAIGQGFIFGHLLALMVAAIFTIRFQGMGVRVIAQLILGTLLGGIVWGAHLYLFLYQVSPDLGVLVQAGFLLSLGFIITANAGKIPTISRFIIGVFVTSILIFLPIYISYQNYLTDMSQQALLYFQADNPNDSLLIGIPFALMIAVFGHLSILLGDSD